MQFRVLGPLELAGRGRTHGLASARRRHLLARLLVAAGRAVPTDRLIEAVWGHDPPGSARASLQSHVSRLRTGLREVGGDRERIVTRGGGYALELADGDAVDAAAFERETDRAHRLLEEDPRAALELLEDALGRWRGPPYADAREAVGDEVRRLETLRRSARDLRVDALLALGRHDTAVAELEGRVEQQPHDERLAGQLMVALFRSGRQTEAVESFHAFRQRLADEFGVDPSPELTDRYAAMLRQDERIVGPADAQRAGATPRPDDRDPGAGPPQAIGRSPTSFVGREAAVTAITELLDREALVTLTGPGGVGKTRLARAVLAQAGSDGGDTALIELAAVRDAASLGRAVAGALGIVPGDGPVRDQLVAALRGRRLLVVADNCEHLLPEVGELIGYLVRRCPSLTVLATSRQRLSVDGEHRWPVRPLEPPPAGSSPTPEALADNPAVRLFCDRARAAEPGFALTADNAAAVGEVCRRLDGVPLALELAAARVAGFPVAELAARLDDRFRLLTAGPQRQGGRHRTLRQVVSWSYELLDDREARLFDRLSVFAGGFTIRAAEQVTGSHDGEGAGIAGDLASLVDKSMVVRTGRRYGLLETLRLYGRERLRERGRSAPVRERHARFYARLAEQAGPGVKGPDERPCVQRLDRELDNLRAAHRWAVEDGDADLALRLSAPLAMYADWWLVDEISHWAEEAAEMAAGEDHPLLPLAFGLAARGAANRGELERSAALARRGLAAAPDEDDPRRIMGLKSLSLVAFYGGRLEESSDYEARVLALAQAAGDEFHVVFAWVMRALIATYRGDPEAARAAAERACAGADELGNIHLRAIAAYCRGEALASQDPDAALSWLEQAITPARDLGTRLVEAIALVTRSSIHARRGEPGPALASFRDAITRLRRGGDWTHQWTTLRNLTFLLARIGADEPAATLLGAIETTDTAAEVYGRDAERLRATAERLRERLGERRFEQAHGRGRGFSDSEAVDLALATIDEQAAGDR